MIYELKPGDIVTIDGATGVVSDIRPMSNGYYTFKLDPAAVRQELPDVAVKLLMKLAKGWNLQVKDGETLIRVMEGPYRDGKINKPTFELVKPYLTSVRVDGHICYKISEEAWPDFVALNTGDLVEILIDDPATRRRARVTEVRDDGLYIGVEFEKKILTGNGWFRRRSLRRVFEQLSDKEIAKRLHAANPIHFDGSLPLIPADADLPTYDPAEDFI